ncbi:hypothetical protein N7466_009431 [Penicillium verhagenii]|uniref:uncharacterized protein n=1 Tax=Penicillium verhagenii TaxID=1562060 RepID=UPI0025457CA4|nr:uncharacterized protein N7466_009431 [Penicillium verhagenii]KAJ5921105.1 hypothetical protein N7466_009431 [Penicillium verhagenii]
METAAAYAVVDWFHGLANSSMTDAERASLSPGSDEYRWRVGGSKVQPAVAKLHIYFTVILNVVTDVELMSIPIPMLAKAKMRWLEKTRLLIIFSGGIFVMTAGILRCVLILTGGSKSAAEGAAWARRESFVAVAVGNFPMIYPLMRRIARKAGLIVSQGSSRDYPKNTQSHSALQSTNRKRSSIPLVSRKNNEWNTIDDELASIDTGRKEPATRVTASSNWDKCDTNGRPTGIQVVSETIIERSG